MTSLVNPFFPKNTNTEQNLFDGLYQESIQVAGRTFQYLPRNLQNSNIIMGEDVLSSFDLAVDIEGYMETNVGFQGDKELFSKFGLEIHDQTTIIISQARWLKEVEPQLTKAALTHTRPAEGDLIFDPLTKRLFEIKFVDHDIEFYAIGKNYTYHLSCEAFRYSNEDIHTGIAEIDAFELENTADLLSYQMMTEAGDMIITEEGGFFLQDFTTPNPLDWQLMTEDFILLTTENSLYILQDNPENTRDTNYGVDFDLHNDSISFNVLNPFGDAA